MIAPCMRFIPHMKARRPIHTSFYRFRPGDYHRNVQTRLFPRASA